MKLVTESNTQDSTIDFEKRRNVPVRYNRELLQTTIKAMKRIAEIKSRREHAFWKNRSEDHTLELLKFLIKQISYRMAASKEKLRAHRKKVHAKRDAISAQLVEPISTEGETVREKIKVPATRSALVPGEGRSMGMDMD